MNQNFEKLDPILLKTNHSLVISVAPSVGVRGTVFETAIKKLYQQKTEPTKESPIALYITGDKRLCTARFESWKTKFRCLMTDNLQLTADQLIQKLTWSQLLISTPQNLNMLTTKWMELKNIWSAVQLCLIDDEFYTMKNKYAGIALEAIVSRLKILAASTGTQLRFIVICSASSNIDKLFNWIQSGGYTVQKESFGSAVNEVVPLMCSEMMENGDKEEVLRNIYNYATDQIILIYCFSKQTAEECALYLMKPLAASKRSVNLTNMGYEELKLI